MESIFEKLWRLGPAAFVLKAIFAAVVADALFLAFILLRRTYRRRYFAKRDACVFQWRQKWDDLLSARVPYSAWRTNAFDRRIIETIALDGLEAGSPEECARILRFLRFSGLLEKHIFEARHFTGWRRMRALVALGRTRAPEGIPALADALRDRDLESRLAALRGLGRTASPKAAEEILAWVGEKGLVVPALPLQSALIQCCAERPQLLLPYVQSATGSLREVLGRVLGEVATPSMGLDLLQFVGDDLDELRAAAARALTQSPSGLAFDVLTELARDPIWFVRLRAIVSLGKLSERRAIPALLRGLTDSNRLVRLRAAEALVALKTEMLPIFQQVVAARDRYGLHAYLTAVENANVLAKLEEEVRTAAALTGDEKDRLQSVLRSGSLHASESAGPAHDSSGTAVIRFLDISNHTLFWYYVASNLAYLTMLLIALKTSAAHQRKLQSYHLKWIADTPMAPPITLIVPAHNQESSIRVAVRNLLKLDYPELEVIVVNDGSKDRTLDEMREEFHLRPVRAVYVAQLKCEAIRGLYRSSVDSRLLVIDKEPGGSKADAINAGLNAATSPYVCIVDADSMLERDALLRIMLPVLADPQHVVAVGGIIRVLNGSEIAAGNLRRVRLPRKSIEIIQVIEYLRAFLIGREAWGQGNMLMIISGAFGVFRTDLVRAVGGYRAKAIGEDFDLVARLHKHLLEKRAEYRIHFVPDPMCWTEVPSDLQSLGRQRARWQKGLLDVLWLTRSMLFRPRYGRVGFFALPYLWLFEFAAPVIEIAGIATIVLAAAFGVLSRGFFLQFLLFGYAFATVISIGSVLQEEITYKRYNDWQDVVRLVSYCFFEHFPYRQLHMFWRLQGIWQYLRGDNAWAPLKRKGLQSASVP